MAVASPDRMLRRVVLARPVEGVPAEANFRIEEFARPVVGEGSFLARNVYCSADPGTRARMSAGVSYAAPLAAGEVISSFAIGQVIESLHPDYAAGEWIAHASGWTEAQLCNGRGYVQKIPPQWTTADARRRVPLSSWIGVLGIPGMTAWFGLNRVGSLREGDRVLVSSAAGPVGATAGQIAKKKGAARVVGIAGGEAKCRWLREVAGFDQTIDYKALRALAGTGSAADATYARMLAEAVAAAMPEGVDLLFDNVGNALIDAVLPQMRVRGRIVISGSLADYNRAGDPPPGLHNTRHFIASRLRMEGILVFDDRREFAPAQDTLAGWLASGDLAWREERSSGIEALPAAFAGLFRGDSFGRRIVQLAPEGL